MVRTGKLESSAAEVRGLHIDALAEQRPAGEDGCASAAGARSPCSSVSPVTMMLPQACGSSCTVHKSLLHAHPFLMLALLATAVGRIFIGARGGAMRSCVPCTGALLAAKERRQGLQTELAGVRAALSELEGPPAAEHAERAGGLPGPLVRHLLVRHRPHVCRGRS